MPWYKITLTEKQLSTNENKVLIEAFQEIYNRFKSEAANMALFGVEGDNCTYYLNAIAGTNCKEIRKAYAAKETKPGKQLHRVAGEIGPQIFNS